MSKKVEQSMAGVVLGLPAPSVNLSSLTLITTPSERIFCVLIHWYIGALTKPLLCIISIANIPYSQMNVLPKEDRLKMPHQWRARHVVPKLDMKSREAGL